MSVDLYSQSLISHINGFKKTHLQACLVPLFASHFDLAPLLHLWPRKLGPFHKHAARPSLIITLLSKFKRRRKNRRVGYKWALSLSLPIRYTYLDHVTLSNNSSACTSEASLPCLQITCFRENNVRVISSREHPPPGKPPGIPRAFKKKIQMPGPAGNLCWQMPRPPFLLWWSNIPGPPVHRINIQNYYNRSRNESLRLKNDKANGFIAFTGLLWSINALHLLQKDSV